MKRKVVTPSTEHGQSKKKQSKTQNDDEFTESPGRRVLFAGDTASSPGDRNTRRSSHSVAVAVTPSKPTEQGGAKSEVTHTSSTPVPSAKRRLLFGRYVEAAEIPTNVTRVYKLVRKLTGSIGGNGYSGPIYGELTCHSMQKVIDKMIETTGFSSKSRFIDVGSGIGKPNLHVAQYPGVELSIGVEMEYTRWTLGMTCLKAVVDEAVKDEQSKSPSSNQTKILGNTMFLHKNMLEASTFDPFTHVYMFSIGFPPELWLDLAEMWNTSDKSKCKYLICYHGPKDIIDSYHFDVDLITQLSTSMHGSKEGHMGYIYKRSSGGKPGRAEEKKEAEDSSLSYVNGIPCDKLIEDSYRLIAQKDTVALQSEVDEQVAKVMDTGRSTRSRNTSTEFSKSY
mmetsp:Transcript_51786/g.125015  ORF Transcript_51786/g.125015 Transcript_51786/m.125015 type:complete len:394 (+) Transcript_51786:554-1735(+)